jgi:hypothetical protein
VPVGFRLDLDQSGYWSNAREARHDIRLPTLHERWGRVTGYQVEFDRGRAMISSRADLFRDAGGARAFLDWYDRQMRRYLVGILRRAPAPLGREGWVYRTRSPVPFALVIWREGRIFAGVEGERVAPDLTLALARIQQRRITAALR